MIRNILATLFFSFSFIVSISQTTIQWQKSLGGSDEELGSYIQQTNDGGYIVAGQSSSIDGDVSGNHGLTDYWVVKLTNIGTIEWQKSLGGTAEDFANSIQQTNDGGYIIVGFSQSNDGDVTGNQGFYDCWVVKLNDIGTIEWQKSLGGSSFDAGSSIQLTSDGGYIIAGSSSSNDGDVSGNHNSQDCWVVKLSSIGAIEWQKSLGGSSADQAGFIQQTSDGGYVFAGWSLSNDGDVTGNQGYYDYWVVKLSNIGTIEWQKSLGGSYNDLPSAIQQTNDGGFMLAGTSLSNDGDVSGNHGELDCWLVKLSSIGTIEWQKSLGGSGSDRAGSIQQTNDGGFIAVGTSNSNDGDVSSNYGETDFWVVKLSDVGIIEWQKSFGGSGIDFGVSIQQTNDGAYIVAGQSSSNDVDVSGNHGNDDYWVVKLYCEAVTEPLLSFAYANDPCRMNNTSPELPAGFASGGTFSVSPALPINSANGTLELLEDTEGEFIVTYSYAGGNCIASGSFSDTLAIRTFSENLVTFIPSIFSPNGKGPESNEKFCVLSDCVAQFKLVIYNRWGQQVFETEDINQCWDGTFNDDDASSGAYAYNVYLMHLDGAVQNKIGTINLVR